MKLKKILSVALCLCVAFSMTACKKSTKTIRVATEIGTAPYEYLDGEKLIGIDIDICKKAFEKTEVIVNDYPDSELFDILKKGDCDIVAAAISADDERLEDVLVTEIYSETELVIVVKNTSNIKTHYGLVGKKVGFVSNSVAKEYVSGIKNAEGMSYEKGSDSIRELLAGRIDAVVLDSSVSDIYIDENIGLVKIEKPIYEKSYVMAVSPQKPEVFEALQARLDEMKEDGTLDKIINSYISAE